MIAGELQIQQFGYGIADGKNPEGVAFKVLVIQDQHTKMKISYIFTPEEFEDFVRGISGRRIVAATELPK